ncbi:hypothetical protein C9374_005920 [Naegleria lovaniensis]|uniref:Uncharacterized protein n=1 Tax=Naegleria lovaniensis TaxID=51637 RepID=A0AA88KJR4_NAELO|nr:uncharacterized protein C9374_005920 [Naegleria lovaniensis]KAG2382128.1 hypothetical protein C9374_005920 [Naegleria lovaniensis]
MVLLERVVKKSGRKIAIRVLQRIGRGFVLSIPLLGGLLAVISSRNDYQRSLKERKQNNQRVEVHKENSNDSKLHLQKMAPYKYFLISSMFNGLDAVLNCGMLYFMIQQRNKAVRASDDDVHDHSGSIFDIVHQLHNALVSHTLENETIIAMLEVGSIASAITATCVAILGEVVSTQTKINEKLEKQL